MFELELRERRFACYLARKHLRLCGRSWSCCGNTLRVQLWPEPWERTSRTAVALKSYAPIRAPFQDRPETAPHPLRAFRGAEIAHAYFSSQILALFQSFFMRNARPIQRELTEFKYSGSC